MAQPSDFNESNHVLGRPVDMTDDQCGPLCVQIAKYPNGTPVVISCWKLTADELAEINKTGRVWLTIIGPTMPPAMIDGIQPK
jgi:hypothetical protein